MPRMCWHPPARPHLFHFTEPAHAEAIVRHDRFVVGDGADHGFGLYATDLAPDDTSPATLIETLWQGKAFDMMVNGVVVLAHDEVLLPFEKVAEHIWVHVTGRLGSIIDLAGVALGCGVRKDGHWRFDSSLHV